MASLALKALHLGADKIPDKAFHTIPYFRPEHEENPLSNVNPLKKKKKHRQKGGKQDNREPGSDDEKDNDSSSRDPNAKRQDSTRQQEQQSDDNDDSESESSEGEREVDTKPQRPTRRNRRFQSNRNLDRGYDSDGMTHDKFRGSPAQGGQYYPPPPDHAYEDEAPEQSKDAHDQRQYDAPQVAPDHRFRSQQDGAYEQQPIQMPQPQMPQPHMHQSQANSAPRAFSVASNDRYQPSPTYAPSPEPQRSYTPKRNSVNPGYTPHSSYAEQYSSGYQPSRAYTPPQAYHPSQSGQSQPFQGALAVQHYTPQTTGHSSALAKYAPPMADTRGYPTYTPPRDDYTPSSSPSPERSHRRSKSHKSGSRDDSRSRSRSRDRSRERSDRRGRNRSKESKSHNRSQSVKVKAKEMLNKNRDLGASVVGVVTGGLAGNQIGKGNKFSTIAGAVIGGLGASFFEKQHAEKKEKEEKRQREKERDKELARERERKREQQHRRDKERRNSTDSRRHSSRSRDQRPRSPDYYPIRGQPANTEPDRIPQPFVRSNTPHPRAIPDPPNVHVRFAREDTKEFVKNATAEATARDLNFRSNLAAAQTMTRDVATQTTPDKPPMTRDRARGLFKSAIQRELPGDRIIRAAEKLNEAKKGVFDGTVVEEVFMEMTGVPIGHKEKMKSNWKH